MSKLALLLILILTFSFSVFAAGNPKALAAISGINKIAPLIFQSEIASAKLAAALGMDVTALRQTHPNILPNVLGRLADTRSVEQLQGLLRELKIETGTKAKKEAAPATAEAAPTSDALIAFPTNLSEAQGSAARIAQSWLNDPLLSDLEREEIMAILREQDWDKLVTHFGMDETLYQSARFFLGPVRTSLAGMNPYNARRIAQALMDYLAPHKVAGKKLKVVVAYDTRSSSLNLAKAAIEMLVGNGAEVVMFSSPVAAAVVSNSVPWFEADAALIVGAGNTDITRNAIMILDSTGAILPTRKLWDGLLGRLSPLNPEHSLPFETAKGRGHVILVDGNRTTSYAAAVTTTVVLRPKMALEKGGQIRMALSPLFGAGLNLSTAVLRHSGFNNLHIVADQAKTDGDFKDITKPNPMEPQNLKRLAEDMRAQKADLGFATNTTGGTLGVMVRHRQDMIFLSQEAVAELLLYYMLSTRAELGSLTDSSYVILSNTPIGSTLHKIAEHFGVLVVDSANPKTWTDVAAAMTEWGTEGFLFATDQGMGYLLHPHARLEDSAGPTVLLSEMALYYKLRGMTLVDVYQQLIAPHFSSTATAPAAPRPKLER
jgi:phosphoglucomutase